MPSRPSVWSRISNTAKEARDGFLEGWNGGPTTQDLESSGEPTPEPKGEKVKEARSFKSAYRDAYRQGMEKKMTPEEKMVAEKIAKDDARRERLDAWLLPTALDETLQDLEYQEMPPSPIPLIRIIQLLPGDEWDPIEVMFDVAAVDSVEFEALSYTWGDPTVKVPIKCNGRRLNVTTNLKSALRDLRKPDTPRRLWVDAICINQFDLLEREEQVRNMRHVYSSSERTIAWLGETFWDADIAFSTLRRTYDLHYETIAEGTFDFTSLLYKDEVIPEESLGGKPTDAELNALFKIISRPYFHRCWVIQEVALGQKATLMCGTEEMDWDVFHGGCLICFYLGWHGAESRTTLFSPIFDLDFARSSALNGSAVETLEILPLLNRFRRLQATDDRDKVFALFGLTVSDLGELALTPNYRMETEQVYINVAKAIITNCDTLDIFAIARGSTNLRSKLPSWVPDWSDSAPQTQSYFARDTAGSDDNPSTPFNASGFSTLPIPVFLPGNRLQLRGHRIDRLASTSDFLLNSSFDYSDLGARTAALKKPYLGLREAIGGLGDMIVYGYQTLEDVARYHDITVRWDDFVLGQNAGSAQAMYGPTGETREVAYMKVMCADFMPNGEDFALESFRKWREERWASAMLRKAKLHNIPALHRAFGAASTLFPQKSSNSPFSGLVEEALWRRIAWTERGWLGMMPPAAQEGDEIWLIQGCRLPLVLRSKTDTADMELIGTCYLHGAMYGDRFKQSACQDVVFA